MVNLYIVYQRNLSLGLSFWIFTWINYLLLLWPVEWNKMHPINWIIWVPLMKLYKVKCHLIVSRHIEAVKKLGQRKIWKFKKLKVPWHIIDRFLSFNDCTISKSKQILTKFFIELHFDYCQLTHFSPIFYS